MRFAILLLAGTLLAGCAQFSALKDLGETVKGAISGSDNAEPPKELASMDTPRVQMTVLWEVDIGAGADDKIVNLVPAVTADRVFAADRKGEVQARSRRTGEKLWDADTELSFASGPVVAGDRLLLGTDNAELVALSAGDGSVLWKTSLSSEVLALPRVEKNTVVVRTTDGLLTALDLASGSRKWVHERSSPLLSVRGLGSPAVAEGLVLDGFGGGKLAALSLADGKLAWEANVAIPHGRSEIERLVELDAEPLIRGDTAYVTGHQAGIAAVALKGGEVLWRQEQVSSSQGLAADRKSLFVSDGNSDVWQLDMRTGNDLWKQADLHMRRLTAPAMVRDRLVVGDLEGYVHALSKDDGSLLGRVQVGSDPILATPVVYEDVIYVYTASGALAAITLE